MRGDKCYPGRGKWVKIPLLPENVGKEVLMTQTNLFSTIPNPDDSRFQIPTLFS